MTSKQNGRSNGGAFPEDVARPRMDHDAAPEPVIRIPKTAEIVASHIRNLIIRGELNEGDYLQPEGQLMKRFTTSRPTLREAFRILENEGLIHVTRGSRTGARVHRPQVDCVARYAGFALQAEGTTLGDIYTARLAIMPLAARLAAENGTKAAVTKLRRELKRMRESLDTGDVDEYLKVINHFPQTIVDLSGNMTLRLVSLVLQAVVEKHQSHVTGSPKIGRMKGEGRMKLYRASLRSIDKLISFIEAKDGAGAEAHWRSHVQASNDLWVDSYDKTALVDVLD